MKFGLIIVPQVRKGEPEPYDDILDQIDHAEQLGYDSVWLTEHHFSEYGRAGVPALAGAAIARTSRIRVSTAVSVLPFHHPLRVAEDWATLDHISKGRVDVGIGRGNQPAEFRAFGISMDEAEERFSESLEVIRRAWTEERISHEGQFWSFPEIEVLPKPFTRPHPPLWQAASSDATVKKVVDRGINGLIGPYLTPYEVLKEKYFDPWHRLTAEAGRPDLQMCHNEFVYVGESDEQVAKDIREQVMWYVRKAAKIWGERDPRKASKQFAYLADVLKYLETVEFDEVSDKLAAFGTPDKVSEKVAWMRDEGRCDYLMNFMSFGGLSHEKALRNMELFASEVMPRFRDDVVTSPAATDAATRP